MMAARLGLNTAARRVAALADDLSARLEAAEDEAFTAIGRAYDPDVAVKQVGGMLTAGRTVAQIRGRKATVTDLQAEQAAAGGLARQAVVRLSEASVALSGESVVKELRLCERTLPSGFAGLADDVADNLDGLDVAAHLDDYDAAIDRAVEMFGRDVRVQLGKASEDDVLARLFSPTPVRGVRGFGGRGVWWRTVTSANAAARAVSIQTANTVRMAAMDVFNTLGAGRG